MNRLGFRIERARDVAARAEGNEGTGEITLMTHFACADEPGGHLDALARFNEGDRRSAVRPLAGQLQPPASTSAASVRAAAPAPGSRVGSARHHALWRPPFSHASRSAMSLQLKAAMTVTTEVIAIQSLQPGERVGYGAAYTAKRNERIAVIACGYADGYPRHAPSGTPVLVDGQRAPIAGRVSMDKITVDVTDVPLARVGSQVQLWGDRLAVDEVANAAGTIGYELLTAIAARVPRRDCLTPRKPASGVAIQDLSTPATIHAFKRRTVAGGVLLRFRFPS